MFLIRCVVWNEVILKFFLPIWGNKRYLQEWKDCLKKPFFSDFVPNYILRKLHTKLRLMLILRKDNIYICWFTTESKSFHWWIQKNLYLKLGWYYNCNQGLEWCQMKVGSLTYAVMGTDNKVINKRERTHWRINE